MKFKRKDSIKTQIEESSLLGITPVQIVLAVLAAVCAYYGFMMAAVILFLAAVTGLAGKAWTKAAGRNVSLQISVGRNSVFPGDVFPVVFTVNNEKVLPAGWVSMEGYLKKPYVCQPGEELSPYLRNMTAEEKEAEKIPPNEEGEVFRLLCSSIGGYSRSEFKTVWKACRRGLYSLREMKCYTGDSLGIAKCKVRIDSSSKRDIAVYPQLVPVNLSPFIHNIWEGEPNARGVLEDVSLIKLTRPYEEHDSQKKINWRLLARGQEMMTNQYEVIRPKKIHFLFDGESFNGRKSSEEDLENTLSVLASLLLRLDDYGLASGFSFPESRRLPASNIPAAKESVGEVLYRMAEYEMHSPEIRLEGPEKKEVKIYQTSAFKVDGMAEHIARATSCYFVTYDEDSAASSPLLAEMKNVPVKIITYSQLMKLKGRFDA